MNSIKKTKVVKRISENEFEEIGNLIEVSHNLDDDEINKRLVQLSNEAILLMTWGMFRFPLKLQNNLTTEVMIREPHAIPAAQAI